MGLHGLLQGQLFFFTFYRPQSLIRQATSTGRRRGRNEGIKYSRRVGKSEKPWENYRYFIAGEGRKSIVLFRKFPGFALSSF
jgi:hypothetical protein